MINGGFAKDNKWLLRVVIALYAGIEVVVIIYIALWITRGY